jgi:hypothetical protein
VEKYHRDEKTIRKYFDELNFRSKLIKSNSHSKSEKSFVQPNLELVRIGLIFDTTFFKKRFGAMVYRSDGKNLKCSFVPTERLDYYLSDLHELSKQYCFTSFTIDGRKGLIQLLQKHFPNTPIQICHFHQVAIVTRYTTRNPKTGCGVELLKLIKTLKTSIKETFIKKFNDFQNKYKDFLKERNEQGQFQHRKLRSAIRSIKSNLSYLFTFQDYKELKIEPTTNSCEGSFGQWKYKVKLHRGMSDDRMQQMIRKLLGCP